MHFVEAKRILSQNNGMNVYRGCSHGCIYCDGRSKCYGFTHPFEDIEVKENAPLLLEKALRSKRQKCMIGTGSMCDPYLHAEEKLRITRQCLEIIDKYEFGVSVLTKSCRILRDMDLLKSINAKSKAVVQMTMTTYDEELCRMIEPNVSTTKERFDTLLKFHEEGIPTVVWLSPILPFINDTMDNINGILDYCVKAKVAGILCFGMGVTLRDGDREYFYEALDRSFPGMREKYAGTFGNAYEVSSPDNGELMAEFRRVCKGHDIIYDPNKVFAYLNEYPEKCQQLSFFN